MLQRKPAANARDANDERKMALAERSGCDAAGGSDQSTMAAHFFGSENPLGRQIEAKDSTRSYSRREMFIFR